MTTLAMHFDDLLWPMPERDRERHRTELVLGFSVPVNRENGRRYWVNPDRTVTDTPKAPRLAEPEE